MVRFFTHFDIFLPFIQKLFSNLFFYFGIEFHRKGTHEQPKDGFALIALKVLFQGRKGQIWLLFTFIYVIQ